MLARHHVEPILLFPSLSCNKFNSMEQNMSIVGILCISHVSHKKSNVRLIFSDTKRISILFGEHKVLYDVEFDYKATALLLSRMWAKNRKPTQDELQEESMQALFRQLSIQELPSHTTFIEKFSLSQDMIIKINQNLAFTWKPFPLYSNSNGTSDAWIKRVEI